MVDVTRNGPVLWQTMLEELNLTGAVVAGGCVRDWCLNVEPKDIDICVPCENLTELNEIVYGLRNSRYFDVHPMYEDEEYEADCEGDLIGVLEGEGFGLPINIIARTAHLDGPQALIDSFDFDILQAYHDGGTLKWNVAQGIACKRGVATMAHDRHIDQSIARFMRFNARHPGLLCLNVPFDTKDYNIAQLLPESRV